MKSLQIILSFVFFLGLGTTQAQKSKLYGSWQATNGSITSFDRQYMTVAGSPYRYTVKGNIITVYDDMNNTMQYKYQVKGKKLYLYVEGVGTYVLTKTGSAQNTGYTKRSGNRGGNTSANARLYGSFCSYSSSYNGGYSTTKKVTFDGRGHYTYGSESAYSQGGDGYSGGDGGYSGTYKVVGNKGVILTASDGSQYRVAIYYVQNSGEITELKYDGVVYGKSLCD